jgi:hypothetical protein
MCETLTVIADRSTFNDHRQEIENYYKNDKNKNKIFLIIFFDNIEYLFLKKKQVLIYTLLEIINMSNNILFCGTTFNFNLMDLMEKRIRSRFSQKTIYINIEDHEQIINSLQKHVNQLVVKDNNQIKLNKNTITSFFDECILKNSVFVDLIQKLVNLGLGIKEIITKIRYLIMNILIEIKTISEDKDDENINYNFVNKEKKNVFSPKEKLENTIVKVIKQYVEEETRGSYFNLLKSKIIYN